jgi:hypothetical protein
MRKNLFIVELIKSPPFIIFLVLILLITIGVLLSNHREKVVKMKEDVLYVAPNPSE